MQVGSGDGSEGGVAMEMLEYGPTETETDGGGRRKSSVVEFYRGTGIRISVPQFLVRLVEMRRIPRVMFGSSEIGDRKERIRSEPTTNK